MSKPIVIFDNNIDIPEIEKALLLHPEVASNTIDQTKIDGIAMPMIVFNDNMLLPNQIMNFELKCIDILPTLSITIRDMDGSLKLFCVPGKDNYIQIQILPKFDNAYKKINLLFYVVDYKNYGDVLSFECIYKSTALNDGRLESLGNTTTYNMCSTIASTCRLGFVSNLASTNDNRWIYCDNKSYLDLLGHELGCAGSKFQIMESWVDLYNNLVLMDIYDRMHEIEDDLFIWTSKSSAIDAGNEMAGLDSEPVSLPAVITNHINFRGTPLFAGRYEDEVATGLGVFGGTDSVNICYSLDLNAEDNWYVADGDVGTDTITKYVYAGEYIGDFNYLAQRDMVNLYKRKINGHRIVATINSIQLGMLRGDKVNFEWYEANYMCADRIKSENDETSTNNEEVFDVEGSPETLILNKKISGQYYITGVEIEYRNFSWSQRLHMLKIDNIIQK